MTTTNEQADLSRGLRLVGRATRPVVQHYRTTVGKHLTRDALMTETRFAFAGDGGARVDLVVRAAKDGIAYRYTLPKNLGPVLGEASAYRIPPDATSWLATYRHPRGGCPPDMRHPSGSSGDPERFRSGRQAEPRTVKWSAVSEGGAGERAARHRRRYPAGELRPVPEQGGGRGVHPRRCDRLAGGTRRGGGDGRVARTG
ncbi:hypothetical protein ALI22I_30475 [Saccharothrix sp. ALI-22-I]|nr:hypothetical protein ALI22I_30475 [Saccharothrix sp. ALI-22-I]